MTVTSKEDGSFSFEQIPFGIWYVREIEQPTGFLMNVTPSTVRLWTSGAVQPSGTAKRLMQIYETGPEIVSKIAGGQPPEDGRDS